MSDDGLAESPAQKQPQLQQTGRVMVDRDGRLVIRLADEGPFESGEARYVEALDVLVDPATLVDQLLVADRPCRFKELAGYANGTNGNAFYYVQLHDSASALVGNEVPKYEFPVVQEKGTFADSFRLDFEKGLVVALSTSQGKFTAGATVMFVAVKILTGGGG